MRYYPAFLDVQGAPCVVVGGGSVAWRKAKQLVACRARVTVVSPEVVRPLARLAAARRIAWHRRPFRSGDVSDAFLVVAATDDEAVNRSVFRRAQRLRRLVNVVDRPALCSFVLPSIVRRGPLTIAISTGGISPALSKWLRLDLGARYGAEFQQVLARMRRWRREVHDQTKSPRRRKRQLERLLRGELVEAGICPCWGRPPRRRDMSSLPRGRRLAQLLCRERKELRIRL